MISALNDEISDGLDDLINILNMCDLKLVELRKINNKYLFEIEEELINYKNKLYENGIKVSLIDSPIGKNKFDFKKEEELFYKYIDICKLFSSKYLRIFTDVGTDIIKTLNKYNEIAKMNNITLLIENEPGTYGENYEYLYNLMKNGFSNIKLLYDVENYYKKNIDYIKAFIVLKPYIKYIHVRDVIDGIYVYLHDGEIDLNRLFKLVDKEMIISLETHLPMNSVLNKKELFIESLRRINYE